MSPESDLKKQMMAEAENIINELLAQRAEKEAIQLSDIERMVRTAGEEMMTRLTAQLVEEEAQQEVSDCCPECGQKMRNKGKKVRNLLTETGEVSLERAYYYCPACHAGHFPPGSTLGGE